MKLYFEIVRASGGYRWRVKGGNHEIMASSEVYTTKDAAKRSVSVVKTNASTAKVYDET